MVRLESSHVILGIYRLYSRDCDEFSYQASDWWAILTPYAVRFMRNVARLFGSIGWDLTQNVSKRGRAMKREEHQDEYSRMEQNPEVD
jgi:hypothetical protein